MSGCEILCSGLLLGLSGLLHRFETLLLDAFLLGLFGGADGVGFLEGSLDVEDVSMGDFEGGVQYDWERKEVMRKRG